MIEVQNLTKKYGENTAVDDISFFVEKGSVCGLLGPNGAGKTTTMNVITGYLAATSGSVLIDGHDIFEEPEQAKRLIGYLPELPPLYPELTPHEQLAFVGGLRGIKKDELAAEIDRVSQLVGIGDMSRRLIRSLSKGYRQRVGLAAALMGDPPVLILDEPTVGLDPKQIIEMRNLIKRLGSDHTVILSSHILSEIEAICDRVIIISKGHIVASDSTGNLSRAAEGAVRVEFTVKAGKTAVKKSISGLKGLSSIKIKELADGAVALSFETKSPDEARKKALGALVSAGCDVLSVTTGETSLEDVFLRLTGDGLGVDDESNL